MHPPPLSAGLHLTMKYDLAPQRSQKPRGAQAEKGQLVSGAAAGFGSRSLPPVGEGS